MHTSDADPARYTTLYHTKKSFQGQESPKRSLCDIVPHALYANYWLRITHTPRVRVRAAVCPKVRIFLNHMS